MTIRDYLAELTRAFNERDAAALGAMVADEFGNHPHGTQSREDLLAMEQMLWTAFPDATLSLEPVLVEGDRAAFYFELSGTHEGEFMGAPGTGKRRTLTGIEIVRIENGVLLERWTGINMFSFHASLTAD